jgi:hypothetical protein
MVRYLIVGAAGGILFGVMDALLNANPLARSLNKAFEPIARTSVNAVLGIVIDLAWGFAMAGIYLAVRGSLPAASGAVNGLLYGAGMWFFRVAMQAASSGMMYRIPAGAILYALCGGLVEMGALGLLYGIALG